MTKFNVGVQLYTVRDETEKDFIQTLKRIAQMGYQGVEFAGYGGFPADELKELLDSLHLKSIGSHVSLDRLRTQLADEIAYNLVIGSRFVVCPYLGEDIRKDFNAWNETLQLFNQVGEEFAANGIQFGYHNHDFEFLEMDGEQNLFDALFAKTNAAHVQVEMDICWVQHGGEDPIAYIKKYADRLPLVHLKDLRVLPSGEVQTVELGAGTVDLPAVLQACEQAQVEWLIVEQDQCQRPSLDSIESSLNWLKGHLPV
jgi:sugar phosphate isomerase/epimerase